MISSDNDHSGGKSPVLSVFCGDECMADCSASPDFQFLGSVTKWFDKYEVANGFDYLRLFVAKQAIDQFSRNKCSPDYLKMVMKCNESTLVSIFWALYDGDNNKAFNEFGEFLVLHGFKIE